MTIAPGQPTPRDHCSTRSIPSPWVSRFAEGLRADGSVLDVACGGGRHTRLFLARGCYVAGVDRDLSGVADLADDPHFAGTVFDLETGAPPPFAGQVFDGVVVTNYLWRPILANLVACVADDGILIYETFAAGQASLGRPANPDFLLRPEELLDAVHGRLVVLAFEQVLVAQSARCVQRICAVGKGHGWVATGAPSAGGAG